MKKYKESLISLKLKSRRMPVDGIVIDYDKDWTLLKYNPVDYVLDGYILVNNKKVKGFQRSQEELFKEKIIKLKTITLMNTNASAIFNLESIVAMLVSRNDLLQIETSSESVTCVGYASLINEESILLSSVNPNGKKGSKRSIPINEIRTIQYENDYLTSLKLYIEHMKSKKK